MVTELSGRACAKINLFLRVTGRRGDGYHELDSIFLPLALADEIRLEVRAAVEPSVIVNCNLPELARNNLAASAARAFMSEFDLVAEVSIELEKRIPVGAGLGGGSSDAATVLCMMAAAAQLTDEDVAGRLHRVALSLGADVPFFLDPRPSRVTGIGERIVEIAGLPRIPIVIAVPPFEVSTAAIFRALEPGAWSGPAPAGHIDAIMRGKIADQHVVNDLAPAAIAQFPEIRRLKGLLEDSGARAAQMSGSGGAVFGLFDSTDKAESAAIKIRKRAPFATVIATTTLDGESDDEVA
ncbi:MAG TPA: 4-(cytidine 5'-diphospho)-2-C-methyl-D-erythritol kinase [Candidatus Binatus sp.]|uniref:4-(cytidine 5'-diphospho)-2-C-methyl-D-erythritol kinase n=1 Tax=Candidatus Binatus sp. TaxID=2811406 RepID=UPI002F4171BF